MNNSDMPAMPQSQAIQGTFPDLKGLVGLTKREHFAGLAMQGMLANPITTVIDEKVVQKMVKIADELLKALEDTK